MANPLETTDFSGRPRVEPSIDVKLTVVEGGRVTLINPFVPTLLGQFKYGSPGTVELSGALTEFADLRDPEGLGLEDAVTAGVYAMIPGVGGSPSGCPHLRTVRVGAGAHAASRSQIGLLSAQGLTTRMTLTSIGYGAWANRLWASFGAVGELAATGLSVSVGYKDDPTFVVSGKKLGPLFDIEYTEGAPAGDKVEVTIAAATPGLATLISTAFNSGDDNFAAGTAALSLDLTSSEFDTVGKVIAYINRQPGYSAKAVETDCDLSTLSSREIDAMAAADISGEGPDGEPASIPRVEAKLGAIAHWVNQNAGKVGPVAGVTAARAAGQTDFPGVGFKGFFTGGADASGVDSTDYQAALDLLDLNEVPSGCLFLDTSDAGIREICLTWIDDQRAKGRMWRAVFGLPAATADADAMAAASTISRHYVMLLHQNALDIRDAAISRPPIMSAAALAGATGGMNAQNDPQTLVLSNARLRHSALPAASRRTMTQRNQLLKSGLTVLKESGGQVLVALAVSCDQGPLRTWRMWSESAALDWIDQSLRDQLEASKVAWTTREYISLVQASVMRLLTTWANPSSPVITSGTDPDTGESVAAYSIPVVTSVNGVTSVDVTVGMAGESDHIRVTGLVRKIALSTTVTA